MNAALSLPSTFILSPAQWAIVWAAVHVIVTGEWRPASEFADLPACEPPESLSDSFDVSTAPILQTPPGIEAVCVTVRDVDRECLNQLWLADKHLDLAPLARAGMPRDGDGWEQAVGMTGAELSLFVEGSVPEYSDDESDATLTFHCRFGDREARAPSDRELTDRLNANLLTALRSNLPDLPTNQTQALAASLRSLAAEIEPTAAS
ncbi:hypothetical protein [Rhodanobacter sp. FW106-PBR-R2A-1-13]|uniref:hypothetical protein n=1 Tax=Rhodanobacter sp. FW106-PBR-R2A-1-13 TaxID=3454845 RepID=UPI0034E49748